jgi:hypothetical protein
MRLGAKQELFAELYCEHILWLYDEGYKVRMGDVFAHDGHKVDSLHYLKLAGDINLFKDGKFITSTVGHKFSGDKWETRHPLCRWGGRYNDGNHYEIRHGNR